MSHSKEFKNRRGRLPYWLDKELTRSKEFLVTCAGCGRTGFVPSILDEGFASASIENRVLLSSLKASYDPLELDDAGLCEVCSQHVDSTTAT